MSSIDSDCFDFQINIWLYLYVTDDPAGLKQCLDSILCQKYKYITLILINDKCDQSSSELISFFKLRFNKKIVLTENRSRLGQYHCKKKAIEYIKKFSCANDVFMEIDCFSSYIREDALNYLILNTLMNKSWLLYGNYNQIDSSPILNDRPFCPFSYYFCCSAFLLNYLSDEDLQGPCETILKLISLCGESRICYLDSPFLTVGSEKSNNVSIAKLTDGIEIPYTVHIVLFVYHRHHNLLAIIKSIDSSICDRPLTLHIVNGNPEKWDQVLILQKYSFSNIKIRLCNTNIDQQSYSRLIYLRDLLKMEPSSFAILLDDSMLIPPDWVQSVIRSSAPLIYACSNGFVFDNRRPIADLSFYNNSMSRTIDKDYYDYGATEGCIFDMSILLSVPLFNLDKKFILSFDELWVSFYVSTVLGLSIKKINYLLFNKVSEDINDFRSNIDFVESSKRLLVNLVDVGFIRSSHININGFNRLLIDEGYYDNCAKNYTKRDFLPLLMSPKDETNIIIQFYYNNYNEHINNISYHTVQNYCLKINCNLIRVDMSEFGRENIVAKKVLVEKIAQLYKRIFLIDGAVYINNSCPNLFTSINNNKISCAFRESNADLDVILFSSAEDLNKIYNSANTEPYIFNRISDDFNYPINVTHASESYKEKLRSKNIINLNFLTDIDFDFIRTYKNTADPKITMVIMNCHRPFALFNTVIPFYDLYCDDIIDQIIIYHAKQETAFTYDFVSKKIFVNNIYNQADENRYVLFNRYIQPGKYAFNECILIVDDDVIPSKELVLETYESWKNNKMNTHGSKGRVCEGSPLFTYSLRDNTYDRTPIILTSFLMVSLQLIQIAIKEEPLFYEQVKQYKPIWNGEDIFLSLLALKLTDQKNFVIGSEDKMIIFKRDCHAISNGDLHIQYRTHLVSTVCEHYKIDKYKFLL